ANSKLAASASVAEVSGFGLAGGLVQLCTAPGSILVDAVSFVVSAVSIGRIQAREPEPAPQPPPHLGRAIAEGLGAIVRDPLLRSAAAGALVQEFFGGLYGALVVLYMARDLGFAPGILGAIWAVGGLSSLLGAMASAPLARRYGSGPAMIVGLFLCS